MTGPLPANLLGAGLGLVGLALLWQRIGLAAAGGVVAALGAATLAALALAGAAAIARAPRRLAATLAHPAQGSFLCAGTMAVTGLALAVPPAAAPALWWAGAAMHAALAAAAAARWIAGGARGTALDTPAFLPVFGSLFVPIGAAVGDAAVAWWFFAVALAVGAPLYAWVLGRSFAPGWTPTPAAVIAIAPWALCVLACDSLGGAAAGWPIDAAAALAVLSFLRIAVLAPRFCRLPFGSGWWAFTFPSTAVASAAVVYAGRAPWAQLPALALAAAASVVVVAVAVRSLPLVLARLRRGIG